MSRYTKYRRIVDSVISRYSDLVVDVYKYAPETKAARTNLYQSPRASSYTGPTAVCAVYLNEVDKDMRTGIGKSNEDESRFTISIPELIRKFPNELENNWITDKDIIVAEGLQYRISGVQYFGRIGGKPDVLQVRCIEYPDQIFLNPDES